MEKQTHKEMVKHPDHYNKGDATYEPYKVIRAWDCNFNIGSAIKYLARYKSKWNPIEDLEKAKQYIDFELESLREKAERDVEEGLSEDESFLGNLFDGRRLDGSRHHPLFDNTVRGCRRNDREKSFCEANF